MVLFSVACNFIANDIKIRGRWTSRFEVNSVAALFQLVILGHALKVISSGKTYSGTVQKKYKNCVIYALDCSMSIVTNEFQKYT